MTRFSFLAGALAVLSVVLAAPQVQFGNTTLVGRDVTILKQEFYGGIPFAQAPIGSLRFEPPVAKGDLGVSTFDASNFGYTCVQPGVATNLTSEDCLSINVFRPAGLPANASLPVMLWIYGGGFLGGSSASFNASAIIYESEKRGTPVIYASLNYRVGVLGFPQGNEANSRNALNLGLKDQLLALKWVQDNIHLFGGDKTKVTVFGESAGAISIGLLYLNSGLEQYARGAIFESGSAGTTSLFKPSRREGDWQTFVAAVPGCAGFVNTTNTFPCLQNASTPQLLAALETATAAAGEEYPWAPLIDGKGGLIPDLPSRLWSQGKFSRIPFITGTNQDDGTLFTPQTINSTAEIFAEIDFASSPSQDGSKALTAALDQLLVLYPDVPALGSPFGTGNNTFGLSPQYKRAAAIVSDLDFGSLRRLWIQTAACAGVKTYGFLFADPSAQYPGTLNPPPAPGSLGVTHASEIPYVYGAPPNVTEAQILSAQIIDYWLSFATSLNPNDGLGTQRPNWTQYTKEYEAVIQLNGLNTTMIPDNYRAKQISFINKDPTVWDR